MGTIGLELGEKDTRGDCMGQAIMEVNLICVLLADIFAS